MRKNNESFGAKINDDSDQIALLSIQGPKALQAMQSLTDLNLNSLPYYGHTICFLCWISKHNNF